MLSKIWQSAALYSKDQFQAEGSSEGQMRRGEKRLPSTALLDFGEVQLQQVIDPCYELLSAKAR